MTWQRLGDGKWCGTKESHFLLFFSDCHSSKGYLPIMFHFVSSWTSEREGHFCTKPQAWSTELWIRYERNPEAKKFISIYMAITSFFAQSQFRVFYSELCRWNWTQFSFSLQEFVKCICFCFGLLCGKTWTTVFNFKMMFVTFFPFQFL